MMTGMAENFKRTDEVEGVKALVESEKDLDGLGHAAITVLSLAFVYAFVSRTPASVYWSM